uniref:SET domain-containing protein n=1 Tax=Mesocestoides corti TaxID=53468 RepID=A0A5K3EIR8_MESCO
MCQCGELISPTCSPEVCPKECKVTYGAPVQFLLATEELSDKPLYMASDSLMSTKGVQQKSGHRGVFLSADRCNYNTHWVFQHVDPQIRLEFEGQPVPVNTPVIIRHCKTNSALAIEHKKSWGLLDFEYEVSSCNHLDGHRAENDTNQICVCTNLDVCESLSDVKSDAEKLLKTMST